MGMQNARGFLRGRASRSITMFRCEAIKEMTVSFVDGRDLQATCLTGVEEVMLACVGRVEALEVASIVVEHKS